MNIPIDDDLFGLSAEKQLWMFYKLLLYWSHT